MNKIYYKLMEINKIKIFGLSYFKILFIFHIFLVTALFLYIGIARKNIPNWFYYLLWILVVIILIYHIYRIYTHGLKTVFWNYFHILLIVPLLAYVAYEKSNTKKLIYDLFVGLGAAAFGINLYYIFAH